MAKRFTDTEIWEEDWFLEMPPKYMLFWQYMLDKCNHAGIWRPNKKAFEVRTGQKIALNKALEYFNAENERVMLLSNGRWCIVGFISFQYGETLNLSNRVHKSVYQLLNTNGVNLTSLRPQVGVKEGAKDKDKDKDILDKKLKANKTFIETYSEFITGLNQITKKKYRGCTKSKEKLKARLSEGITVDEILRATKNAVADDYHQENNLKYITPEFMTRSDKIDKFLNLVVRPKTAAISSSMFQNLANA